MCMLYSFKCNPALLVWNHLELKTTLPLCIHNIPLCVSPSCRSRFMGSKSSGKITLLVWSGSVAVTLIFKSVWYLCMCLIGATVTVTIIQGTNPLVRFLVKFVIYLCFFLGLRSQSTEQAKWNSLTHCNVYPPWCGVNCSSCHCHSSEHR